MQDCQRAIIVIHDGLEERRAVVASDAAVIEVQGVDRLGLQVTLREKLRPLWFHGVAGILHRPNGSIFADDDGQVAISMFYGVQPPG